MKKKLGIQDFADFIVQREGFSRTEAETFVRAFFDVIEQGLEEDKFVKIKGLGTFKLISVSERESVNISTGERFQISGHTKVSFTPDASMKELVNRPFAHFDAVDLNDDTDINEFKEIDDEMHLEAEEVEEANDDDDTDDLEETGENDDDELQISEKVNVNQAISEEEKTATNATIAPQEASRDNVTEEAEDEEPSSTSSSALPTQDAPSTAEEEVCITDEQPVNIVKGEEEASSTDAASVTDATVDHESAEDIVVTTPQTVQTPSATDNEEEPPISTTDDEPKSTSTAQATQGYVYGEVPSPRKRNWWKTIAILCGVIFLMVLSYFAGYYRMLCPGCSEFDLADSWSKPEVPAQQTAPAPAPKPQPAAQPSAPSADTASAASQPNTPAQATPHPSATPQEKSLPKEEKAIEKKDDIPATHVVKVGDNVYRISRKYYGTDAYAERIIKENNLKDANTIVVGMQLKLPRR